MNKNYMLHSICFSEAEALLEAVNNGHLDLVLYGQDSELICSIRDKCRTLRLADIDEEAYVGEKYLYKYQRVDTLVHQLITCMEVELDKSVEGVMFYGVYSPVGRCGKTSFALGICNNYTGSLYVGMNSYIGSTEVDETVFAQAEYFFYQLLTHNNAILSTIQELLANQGGQYAIVYGMRCFADYKQITEEDIVWLRDLLEKNGLIARVVFDVGTSVLADVSILNLFDQIFVPCISDAYANRRMKHFRLLLDDDSYAQLRRKIEYIEIPTEPYDSSVMREFVRRNVK